MQALAPWAERLRESIEGVSAPEWRLAVTVGVVLGAWVVGWVVAPRLAAWVGRPVREWFGSDRVRTLAEVFDKYVPATPAGLLLRTIQLELLVLATIATLVVWGRGDVVLWGSDLLTDRLPLLQQIGVSVVFLVVAYAGGSALADWADDVSQQAEWMTEHQEEILLRISQLGFFAVIALVLVNTVWNVDLGGLLVGAGFLGIVVGFAARQTLGSLIAGFVLMFSRPFTIGDWVQIGDQEGIVTDITIFNTRLENFDGEFVVIPNDRVSNQAITNRSQKGLLRLRIDVGIDYESDPDHAREVALAAISDLREVVDAPPPQVFPKSFGDSAVVLEMRFWIDHPTPPRKWKAVSAVISAVKTAFAEEDIKIPFPQRELSGRAETGGFRVHESGVEAGEPSAPDAQSPE